MRRDNDLQTRGGIDSLVSENEYVESVEDNTAENTEISTQPEGSFDDTEIMEDPAERAKYEEAQQARRKKNKRKDKACSAACLAAGIIGTSLLGLGTAVTCGLYDIMSIPVYAVSVPNGTNPDDVDVTTDKNGDIHVDIDNEDDKKPEDTDKPSGGDSDSSDNKPGDNNSEDNKPGDNNSDDNKPDDNNSDNNKPDDSSEDTKPEKPIGSENIPGTGEIPLERITGLMENELLKAQNIRISQGQSPYLDSDIVIEVTDGLTLETISNAYGFTIEFIAEYNDIIANSITQSTIRIPCI